MADGSLLVGEVWGGTVVRIDAPGSMEVVATCGGGPSGLAVGPDGRVYICNDGGRGDEYHGGRIERLDLRSGELDVLYDTYDGEPLSSPNDLVFDRQGGFYFTNFGKFRARGQDKGTLFYALADGSSLQRIDDPLFEPRGIGAPNGIGLSADERTLYFVETFTGRLWGRTIVSPGNLEPSQTLDEAFLYGTGALEWFDGLAVDTAGNVCVATLRSGTITVVSADGSSVAQMQLPAELLDPMSTNLCFAGPDLTTAYLTLSSTGAVVKFDWPVPGLQLAYQQVPLLADG